MSSCEVNLRDVDDTEGTAAYLGKPAGTLVQWRYQGFGPPYVKLGQAVRYRKPDVDAWLEQQLIRPGGRS